jgi:hypothetical protein
MNVVFEVLGVEYTLPGPQATLLAENLRGHAAGNFPEDDKLIVRLGAAPAWKDGTRAMADAIEDVLAGRTEAPIGLDRGRGAAATYWVLRLMQDLQPDPKGADGLKSALSELLADHELDERILSELRNAHDEAGRGERADRALASAEIADRLNASLDEVRDRLPYLALEGRVEESEVQPNYWCIAVPRKPSL